MITKHAMTSFSLLFVNMAREEWFGISWFSLGIKVVYRFGVGIFGDDLFFYIVFCSVLSAQ